MANSVGLLSNVSTGGLYLNANQRLRVGTSVLLYVPMRLSEAKKKMCVISGTIVRMETKERTARFGYGIRFDPDISSASRRLLTMFVDKETDGELSRLSGSNTNPENPVLRERERPLRDYTRRAQYNLERRNHALQQKTRSQGKKRQRFHPGIYLVMVGIALSVATYGYWSVREAVWISQLSTIVPLQEVTIEAEVLRATTTSDWLLTRSKDTRAKDLNLLASALEKRQITGAKIIDEEGAPVARIFFNLQTRKLVGQLLR